jgi:hypothetical protein
MHHRYQAEARAQDVCEINVAPAAEGGAMDLWIMRCVRAHDAACSSDSAALIVLIAITLPAQTRQHTSKQQRGCPRTGDTRQTCHRW